MATQEEITAQLTETAATLDKIGTETTSLLERITELLAIIANTPEASPELQAAADALKIKAETVDALVEDLPTPPPPTP